MIICVCKAVSDRHIRSAIQAGASCMKDLSRQTGLGTCCGKCVPHAKAALADGLAREDRGSGFFAGAVSAAA
jgi:bacterioferritin-associated ferredoxin